MFSILFGLPKPPKFTVCEFPSGVHELFDLILYCCAFDIHLVRRLIFATRKKNLAVLRMRLLNPCWDIFCFMAFYFLGFLDFISLRHPQLEHRKAN